MIAASVPGSGIAAIDATVVAVALPATGHDLNAGMAALQRVVTGYLLSLASFLLLAGSLRDLFGRRRNHRHQLSPMTLYITALTSVVLRE